MNLTDEEKRILGFLPADEKAEKAVAPIKMPSAYELEYGTVEADGEASFKAALEQTESEDDGMKFGNPTDFAEQFNNTMISVAGFPVDAATWATNRVAQVLFPNTYNAEEPFIDPDAAIGGSSNLKSVLNPLDIGSDRQADTYMGYFGNTTGEAVTFLLGGAGVVQKTKNLNGFIGAISRSADDALRTKLGTVVGGEMAVSAGAAGGRQISEENEFGTTGAFVTEFATGAIALLSAGGVKKLAVDPLVQKLRDTKPEDLLTTLSKEELEKVRDAGRKTIEENEPTPAPKEEPSLEQIQIEEEAARQRGRDNPTPIEPEAPTTPKDTPELTTTDTRGQGQQYHGSSQKIDEFLTDENYLSEGNIYGEGFYTTEALDVAEGYTKKGSGKEPSLYRVDEKAPVNFLDIDTFKFKDLKLKRLSHEFQEIINEFGDEATVRDVFDELRGATDDYGNRLTTDEIIEGAFFPINDKIKEMGYGGIEHVGGKTFNKAPHKVKIYLNPNEQIELKPVTKPEAPATPKDTPEPTSAPKDRVSSKEFVEILSDKIQQLDAGLGQKVDNYTTADGVEITLKDGVDTDIILELNGNQVQGDITLDVIAMKGARGEGKASKELDRILAEADSRDMSVDLEVDPANAALKGEEKGLSATELKEWYQRKGFIFNENGKRGYRPRKSEDANQFITEKVKINQTQADDITKKLNDDDFYSFSDPDTLFEAYYTRKLKQGYYDGGDDSLYYYDGLNRPKKVDNAEIPFDYDTGKYKVEIKPTPAPKTPEAAPEAAPKSPMQQLVADYEKTIADQARGEGADSVVRLNAAFNAASDDFAKRVDALIANPDAKNVDDVTAILDDYILLDGLDADLKQKTGQMLNAQRRDAADNVYTREMAENRQTRQDALKDVREKLQSLKADAKGEELQKLVDSVFEQPAPVKPNKPKNVASPDEDFMPTPKDGDEPTVATPKDTDGTPTVKPEGDAKPAKPKLTPKERAIERLQKRLDELRAIRSGEKDPKEPKPKRAKSAEEKDLEARIAFYRGEAKEVDDIAATLERIQVLSGLLQGGTTAEIRAQIGLPPAFRPSHAKPKKIQSQLTKLKKAEAELMKKLRRRQTDEILNDMRNVFDPENGRRSLVDQGLNKYLLERTDALLNQPSTMTTGLPSGILQVIYRPLASTGKSTIKALNPADRELKGVGMTARMKYASADAIATADQLLHLATHPKEIAKQLGRNLVDTAKAGGQSAYYYKDGNKMDVNLQGAAVGNSTIRNERQVRQAALRVAANEQKNLLVRKALETLGSDPMTTMFVIAKALRSAGRVGVGTADEPFILILEGRKHRADAIRAAIKEQIPKEDVATFIDNYVSKSSQIDNGGVQRFNYLDEKYRNAANEHRRGLFRRGDFEGDDPRMLMEERFAQFWNRATGGDITLGKFFARFLQPIITTPTIALAQAGRGTARVTGIPAALNVGQRLYAGAAKRIGKDGKISNALSGRINNEINDLEIKVNELRAKTKEKGLEPEELERRKLDLAAHNSKLDSLRSYRDEQTYEEIAHMALAMGIFYTFYELGKDGLATGSGAFLTREQRSNGEFKKYRMLADEESEGMSYLLADPFRTLAAVAADLGAWSQLEGSTTEKQTAGNFITSTLEAYATDSVFSTSLRHLKDLAFGQEKSRVGALIDMGAGAIPVPSFIRGARTLDDEVSSVYDEGATVGEIPSRMMDKAVGTPAENFRMDKLGRPLLRPQRGALNYVFRYAPEERANRMVTEEEVHRILRNDGLSFNLIPKFTEHKTIKGTPINLKQFTNGERSLFNLFGEIVNENDDMLHEIGDMINTDDWRGDYNNYSVEPNPDNPDQLYNKGIDRIKEIRSKYIEKAVERISEESSEAQLYRNKDGQTIFEYIEQVEARPPMQGNILEKLNQF